MPRGYWLVYSSAGHQRAFSDRTEALDWLESQDSSDIRWSMTKQPLTKQPTGNPPPVPPSRPELSRWDRLGSEGEALESLSEKVSESQGIRPNLDTEESREFWRKIRESAEEVRRWPAWKRGLATSYRDCPTCNKPGCAGC